VNSASTNDILDELVERIKGLSVNIPGHELNTDELVRWADGFLEAIREVKDEIDKLKKEYDGCE
jgi:uncharacterized coiled-coil DUF342 family protein